jgi:hypothetical protein
LIFQEPSEQEPITINHRLRDEYDEEVSGGKITFYYLLSEVGDTLLQHYNYLFPSPE